jgi:hypothetical protein
VTATRATLTKKIVRELLHYDPETGVFTWRRRKRKWFKSDGTFKSWNIRHAGKTAFSANNINYNYFKGHLLGMNVSAHHLAFMYMLGRWPHPETDHINRDGTDNRWSNLREVTHVQNTRNRGRLKRNSAEVIGVRLRSNGLYEVGLGDEYLGKFDTLKKAAAARRRAEREWWSRQNLDEVTP